jgi:flagellar basal-body rod protein FlgC
MDYFRSFQISAAGLEAETLRMEAAALNLANANTTAPPGTQPFQALDVVSEATAGVRLEPRTSAPRLVYDRAHPHANAEGFVAYANVDVLSEMVAMMRATRAYEANIKAVNAAKAMAQQALQIGEGK